MYPERVISESKTPSNRSLVSRVLSNWTSTSQSNTLQRAASFRMANQVEQLLEFIFKNYETYSDGSNTITVVSSQDTLGSNVS
jgi:hypothetical protein